MWAYKMSIVPGSREAASSPSPDLLVSGHNDNNIFVVKKTGSLNRLRRQRNVRQQRNDLRRSRSFPTLPEADGRFNPCSVLRPRHDVGGALLELLRDRDSAIDQEAIRHSRSLGKRIVVDLQSWSGRWTIERNYVCERGSDSGWNSSARSDRRWESDRKSSPLVFSQSTFNETWHRQRDISLALTKKSSELESQSTSVVCVCATSVNFLQKSTF